MTDTPEKKPRGCKCKFCTRDRRFDEAIKGAADEAFLREVYERFTEMEYDYDRLRYTKEAFDD
ncbi:hypothetical protein [Sphingopyxis sp. Geo48]|uniref:hypothetical protein n=1 Tax=Sphingopyxis sp. Geo48 TaxID=545241 RepID=UPI0024B74F4C|nr:hypothetical protein [Sphingopyxis sp. Geo48]